MDGGNRIEGGCRCGAVRYRVTAPSLWVSHCHCGDCRRSSGAPVSTFVGVATGTFAFVSGTPGLHESSPGVKRHFCRDCGTPLTYEATFFPGEVHIMAGSLDAPEHIAPQRHVFTREQMPWLRIDDELPRHDTLSRDVTRL